MRASLLGSSIFIVPQAQAGLSGLFLPALQYEFRHGSMAASGVPQVHAKSDDFELEDLQPTAATSRNRDRIESVVRMEVEECLRDGQLLAGMLATGAFCHARLFGAHTHNVARGADRGRTASRLRASALAAACASERRRALRVVVPMTLLAAKSRASREPEHLPGPPRADPQRPLGACPTAIFLRPLQRSSGRSVDVPSPFRDPSEFKFVAGLEAAIDAILAELRQLSEDDFVASPDSLTTVRDGYDENGWRYFALIDESAPLEARPTPMSRDRARVPCRSGPDQRWLLVPPSGTHLYPHRGEQSGTAALPLGTRRSARRRRAALRRRDAPVASRQCLIFDDTFEHEAWNRTSGERVVLIVTFERARPGAARRRQLTPFVVHLRLISKRQRSGARQGSVGFRSLRIA
jgi:beta-hydroxylase